MQKKKILFVSVNRHQKNYFSQIGEHLSKEYDIFYFHYNVSYYRDMLLPVSESALPSSLTTESIDRSIYFSFKKGQIRKFTGLRGYLHKEATLRRIAKHVFTRIWNYLQSNHIDMVCVWNGNTVERAAAIEAAKAYGAKTCFFENGLLPNTTTLDPKGVNAAGILAEKTADFFRDLPIDRSKLDALLTEEPPIRAQKKKWYQKKKASPSIAEETPDLDTPYLFVPFQVNDDTQIILHSPYIRNMAELTEWVAAAVRQYNESNQKKLRIIIKEHPSDNGRCNYDDLRIQYPDITFLKTGSTKQLISKATAVITVNSTVGMEALLQHKHVITLGNATYAIDGIAARACSIPELIDAISHSDTECNVDLIDKFLYYIRYQYSIEGSWRNPTDEHFKSIMERITEILND
ncbi:MAG: hypothetical protein IIW62_01565 [Selenomonadales bacterium]|nr:hypothetical protein [Selenomonadales bacterium]